MCGRYYIDDTTAREVEKAVGRLDGKLDMTGGDVLPSQGAAVLRGQRGRLTADVMTWGFPGIDKGKLLINARAESALEKKTFRESMLHRRCIIPARGFYEWDRSRTKFSYERKDAPVLFMAGCYDLYEDEERFVILTTEARGNVLGDAMFYGSGAGKLPTASAVVADVVEMAKNLDKNIPVEWSSKKLELVDYRSAKNRFFVRVSGTDKTFVEKVFGNVEYIDAQGVTGELGFVTEVMTEEALENKKAAYGEVLNVIRVA